MESVIQVKDLKKYFGDVKAVDGISFQIEQGELFGFLGINGAGKSQPSTCSVHCIRQRREKLKSVVFWWGEMTRRSESESG